MVAIFNVTIDGNKYDIRSRNTLLRPSADGQTLTIRNAAGTEVGYYNTSTRVLGLRTTGIAKCISIMNQNGGEIGQIGGAEDSGGGVPIALSLSNGAQIMLRASITINAPISESGSTIRLTPRGDVNPGVSITSGGNNFDTVVIQKVGGQTKNILTIPVNYGSVTVEPLAGLRVANMTTAQMPAAAAALKGSIIFVTDAAAGAQLKYCGDDGVGGYKWWTFTAT